MLKFVIFQILKVATNLHWWLNKILLLCFNIVLISKDWETIALLISILPTMCFLAEKIWWLSYTKKRRIRHVLFLITLNTISERYVAQTVTMVDTWSSPLLVKIFIIDGSCSQFYAKYGRFSWTFHFRTNTLLPNSEHLVLGAVYLKILNICEILIVKIVIWLQILPQAKNRLEIWWLHG